MQGQGIGSRVPSPVLVVCGDSKLPLDYSLGTKTSAVAIGYVGSSCPHSRCAGVAQG